MAADTRGSADRRLREELADVRVHVGDAILRRNLGEIGHPLDASCLLELCPRILGAAAAGEAVAAVIDDERHLRPVLGRSADVAHVGVREQVRELLLDRRREQSLVHAHLVVAGLEQLLVERIDELVVVHPPRVLAEVLVGVVADRIALERVGLEVTDGVVDLLHPPWIARREDGVAQQASRAGLTVHAGPRLGLHLVGEEPVLRHCLARPSARSLAICGVCASAALTS